MDRLAQMHPRNIPPEVSSPLPALREGAAAIVRALRRAGHEAYWVGGCVRDLIRGIPPADFDIATSATPDEVEGLFPRTVPVGASFGVILVVEDGRPFEVATFRTEGGYADGRRPDTVRFAGAEEDVRRRDFTINGLLMDPETGGVIDRVGGQADLAARLIRTIGDPEARFGEDRLRMLRAVRFAANLDFVLEAETQAAIVRHAPVIAAVSAERIRGELTRILTEGGARRGMELLAATGLLRVILPEVQALRGVDQPPRFHPEGDVWVHTLRMLELLSEAPPADSRLAWAVLLHDAGKAVTRSEDERGVHFYGHVGEGVRIAADVLRRLRFSRTETEAVLDLVGGHMQFMHVREMRPNRLKRLLRGELFDLHLELHRLDCLGSQGMLDHYDFCVQKRAELDDAVLRPPRLITGRDLIGMGFVPGPRFSEILKAVEDAQLDGEIETPEDARRFVAERWLEN